MTIAEMHMEFKYTADKVDSEAYPEFEPWEIDFFLKESEARIIKQRYGGNNIYKTGFEESQKRIDDLKEIVISKFCETMVSPIYSAMDMNVYVANLQSLYDDEARLVPSDVEYMFYLKSNAQISLLNCDSKWFQVALTQHDRITAIQSDPFNKPKPNKPVIFFENGDVYVWTANESDVTNFMITFIRKPLEMSLGTYDINKPVQDCELSEHLHKEIVQMAVKIALENIEAPRQNTQEENVIKSE